MSIYEDIYKGLSSELMGIGLVLPVSHENIGFDTSNIDSFVKSNIIFSTQESITKTGFSTISCVHQISIYTKIGTSMLGTLNVVDLISTHYKNNLDIFYSTIKITIGNIQLNSGRVDGSFHVLDISISCNIDM